MRFRNFFRNPMLLISLVFAIFGIGLFGVISHTVFKTKQQDTAAQSAAVAKTCSADTNHRHTLTIHSNGITPDSLQAQRCDTVTVVNTTNEKVIPALGPHDHHIAYPGYKEHVLSPGQSYTFRLSQVGTFPLHDHDDEALRATITVKE
jgi:hypothetical protein